MNSIRRLFSTLMVLLIAGCYKSLPVEGNDGDGVGGGGDGVTYDSNLHHNIIGTWRGEITNVLIETWRFHQDGSFSQQYEWLDRDDIDVDELRGTWTVEGDLLEITIRNSGGDLEDTVTEGVTVAIVDDILYFGVSVRIEGDGSSLNGTWRLVELMTIDGVYEGNRFEYEELLTQTLTVDNDECVWEETRVGFKYDETREEEMERINETQSEGGRLYEDGDTVYVEGAPSSWGPAALYPIQVLLNLYAGHEDDGEDEDKDEDEDEDEAKAKVDEGEYEYEYEDKHIFGIRIDSDIIVPAYDDAVYEGPEERGLHRID